MKVTWGPMSKSSELNDSIYGKCVAPIKMFIEKRGESFEQQSVLKNLFCMGTSTSFGDTITSMTAMNGFEPVGELGATPRDGMQEGYKKVLEYETWKDSFAISKELIEDSKLMDLKRQPAAFMTSYGRTREQFGASLFAKAMAGSTSMTFKGRTFDLTGADGVSAFNTQHPGKVSKKKQSNLFSAAFSDTNLGLMETAMQNFRGDNDEILDVAPDTIVIPNNAELKKAVFAAIGADKEPTTSNNAFNYQYGRWTVIVWPYLNQYIASGSPWMLLDSRYNQEYGGAVWNDRIKLEIESTIDYNVGANVWWGRSRFNACFNDWRFAAVGGITGGSSL